MFNTVYKKPYHVSIVIPIFNEGENINRFYNEIIKVIGNNFDYEIIYVDDGSTDDSFGRMLKIKETDKKVKVIRLNRNWGQQNAIYVSLAHIRGDVVIMLDGDGQFDASCIPDLLKEMYGKDLDLVSGVRISRKDKWLNRLTSNIGNYFINKALRIKLRDFGAVKAFRRNLVKKMLSSAPNQLIHPYALAYQFCSSYGEVPVKQHERIFGESKWTLFKRISAYFDIYVTFSSSPFRWLMYLALLIGGLGGLLGFGILFYRLMYPFKLFSGLIIFFALFLTVTGIIFLVLAILGDFVIRVYRSGFAVKAESTIKNIFEFETNMPQKDTEDNIN